MARIFYVETKQSCIQIPKDMMEKVNLVKALYRNSVSMYVVSLIEADLEQNAEKYRELLNSKGDILKS